MDGSRNSGIGGPSNISRRNHVLSQSSGLQRRHRICMISDFFFPDAGGVENHMFTLAQCLLSMGHKVVVVTRGREDRVGIRWMTSGLKVYYVPLQPMPDVFSSGRVTVPSLFATFPLVRNILIRERIDIVHGHQAFSTLGHESFMHARTMGLRTCFTDHSLFGFQDGASIHMNKILEFTLSDTNHVICVSHTSKENTVLRSNIDPMRVSVIPNAVDTTMFTPNPAARSSSRVKVVVVSRLVYRKGIDLMVSVIPEICRKFPFVDFIIGGDGPKRIAIEEMCERHQLYDRVELLGNVPHSQVRSVLTRGHIFLNCSLTEAFCIAILEAACCGLLVVSTKVGGVPEVMPSHMIKYASPDAKDIEAALSSAICNDVKDVDSYRFHEEIKDMYSWFDVAERTSKVYDLIMTPAASNDGSRLVKRLASKYECGRYSGKIFCLVIIIDHLLWLFLRLVQPASSIEPAPDYPIPQIQRSGHLKVPPINNSASSGQKGSGIGNSSFSAGSGNKDSYMSRASLHKRSLSEGVGL